MNATQPCVRMLVKRPYAETGYVEVKPRSEQATCDHEYRPRPLAMWATSGLRKICKNCGTLAR